MDDWSTQLKKIEREFEGLPPEPSPAYKKLQSEEERRAKERAAQRAALIGVFARLILVAAVGVALLFWPYEKSCGLGLSGFLGAEVVIIVGGVWIGVTTWRYRLPRMHVVSLAITLAGLILIASEVLPRVGYAAVDPRNAPSFSCAGTPPPTNPDAPAKTTRNALPASPAEQRVQSAATELQSRWQSRVSELSKQFQPHKAALVRLERPELLSRQNP